MGEEGDEGETMGEEGEKGKRGCCVCVCVCACVCVRSSLTTSIQNTTHTNSVPSDHIFLFLFCLKLILSPETHSH